MIVLANLYPLNIQPSRSSKISTASESGHSQRGSKATKMFGTLQIEMSPVKNRGIINFKARFQMMDATENERLLLSLELMEN